jgi:hypothetical protein
MGFSWQCSADKYSPELTVAHVGGGWDPEAQGEEEAEWDSPPQPFPEPGLLLNHAVKGLRASLRSEPPIQYMRGLQNTTLPFFQSCGSPPLLYFGSGSAFHCNADLYLDTAFYFNVDPDPNLELHRMSESAIIGQQTLHGFIQPL